MTGARDSSCSPCTVKIDSLFPSSSPQLQMLRCHCVVPSRDQLDSLPSENDLVVIDFLNLDLSTCSDYFLGSISAGRVTKKFACVESVQHAVVTSKEPSSKAVKDRALAITFSLKVSGLSITPYLFEGHEVTLAPATSLTISLRQWAALINFHASQLVRDVLSPRGGAYFGSGPAVSCLEGASDGSGYRLVSEWAFLHVAQTHVDR